MLTLEKMKFVKRHITAHALSLFIVGLTCAPFFTSVASNTQPDLLENIGSAIKTGSAQELSTFLGNNIDIKISGEEATYSKKQAEQVLRDFFKKTPPTSFKLIHKGTSREGAKYAIGSLQTNGGKKFRTYIYIKGEQGEKVIEELRFEPQ